MNAVPNPDQPHASIFTTGTAQTLTQLGYTRHAKTEIILIQVLGGKVRFTVNDTPPTSASGLQINDGDRIQIGKVEAGVAKFITESDAPKLEIAGYLP